MVDLVNILGQLYIRGGHSDPLKTIKVCASIIMNIQLTSRPLVKTRNLRLLQDHSTNDFYYTKEILTNTKEISRNKICQFVVLNPIL